MSSAYYPDGSGWACYVDSDGQPQYLLDSAGNYIQYDEAVQSAFASKSDSEKSDKSHGSKRSISSKNSKDSKSSKASKNSKPSDSGQSSNTPATVGWVCYHCGTINYTHHQDIPFMDPIRDNNGDIVYDASGNPMYDDHPYIPCSGCNGNCTPYCDPAWDP